MNQKETLFRARKCQTGWRSGLSKGSESGYQTNHRVSVPKLSKGCICFVTSLPFVSHLRLFVSLRGIEPLKAETKVVPKGT